MNTFELTAQPVVSYNLAYKQAEHDWSKESFKYIAEHREYDWELSWISENPNIDWNIIESTISRNANITRAVAQANQDNQLNWPISENQHINWDFIQVNPDDNWNLWRIRMNRMAGANGLVGATGSVGATGATGSVGATGANGLVGATGRNATEDSKKPTPEKREIFIRKQLQQWFSHSGLKEELMATVWHPRNIDKFHHWDPETFGGLSADNEEEGSF